MSTYKHDVLMTILAELHPNKPITCENTYDSILMLDIDGPIPTFMDDAFREYLQKRTRSRLVPESAIQEKYNEYLLQYNLMLLRRERDQKIHSTDIYTLADFPHATPDIQQAWLLYRQALRDITITNPAPRVDENDNLIGIIWPIAPNNKANTTTTTTTTPQPPLAV